MNLNKVFKAALIVSSLVGAQAAQAALMPCPSNFTFTNAGAKVKNAAGTTTAASACQYQTPNAVVNADLATINTAAFFGHSDWAVNPGNLMVDPPGNNLTGTWTISGFAPGTFDYAIIFKDGEDTNLVGFLFNESVSNGIWSSPFTEPPFDFVNPNAVRQVHHYTIVQRRADVPEPGILGLLGLGLAGLVTVRRRSAKN